MPFDPDARLLPAPGAVIRQEAPREPQVDLDTSVDLLRAVASGALAEERIVRLYSPAPTVAMSMRESRMPGYAAAREAAVRHGFTPAIRPTGGRAVAYDESCLVFDVIAREDGGLDPSEFFARAGNTIVDTLQWLGVDARLGEIAGEYCPGEFSINARGAVKLIGTSQRSVRGARLLSGMLAFGPVDRFVAVLTEVNAALGLDWDPATFGTMEVEDPSLAREAVEDALASAFVTAG